MENPAAKVDKSENPRNPTMAMLKPIGTRSIKSRIMQAMPARPSVRGSTSS